MTNQATFHFEKYVTPTERYVVTFRDKQLNPGLALIKHKAGIKNLVQAADYGDNAVNVEQANKEKGAVFNELDVCILDCPKESAMALSLSAGNDSAILTVEPEYVVQMRDEAKLDDVLDSPSKRFSYFDTSNSTWGLRATGVEASPYSGQGVRVAVLDTGLDLQHPDFVERQFSAKSFVENQNVNDDNGHGTHCAGVAAGPLLPATDSARYGVAYDAELLVGKVLGGAGAGNDMSVLAGLNWALANECVVASLSLGTDLESASTAYEQVGRRALRRGMLIVAAAGNNSRRAQQDFGFVGRPANNRTIMAVGAVEHQLSIAPFSARSSQTTGGEVDLVAPGVEVFSSWALPRTHRSISGTSMATPMVAGIAALYAQAFGLRGKKLWDRLTGDAKDVGLPSVDVGAGLVTAPQ